MWLHSHVALAVIHPESGGGLLRDDEEGELGRAPAAPGVLPLRVGRWLERLVREPKVLEALTFVSIPFPVSYLLAVIAEIGWVLGSFGGLSLLELKLKSCSSLPFQ